MSKQDDQLKELFEAINSGKGGVFGLNVLHDDDCPLLNGGDTCTCEEVGMSLGKLDINAVEEDDGR